MSLGDKQRAFTKMIARLIGFASANGYELTFGDAYRDLRVHGSVGEKKSYSSAVSLHKERLAVDFNLFKSGKYITASEDYRELGEFWESIGGSWGGRFSSPGRKSLQPRARRPEMIALLKQYKLIATGVAMLVVMAVSASGAWQWQANSYGKKLAEQGRKLDADIARRDQLHSDTLSEISRAAAEQLRAEQAKRLKLEDDLAETSKAKHKELTDAKAVTARLRDSLATTELRLSVLLDATGHLQITSVGCLPPPTPETWFMEPREANLTQRMLNELSESPVMRAKD